MKSYKQAYVNNTECTSTRSPSSPVYLLRVLCFAWRLCSDRPSSWCKDNWIHWRALKSAFSVETQLREILLRLQQVQQLSAESAMMDHVTCCPPQPSLRSLIGFFLFSFFHQKKDFPVERFDGDSSELFRRCLCAGYFTNVARRYHHRFTSQSP